MFLSKYFQQQRSIARQAMLTLSAAFFATQSSIHGADEMHSNPRILILNSDSDVERYEQVKSAFTSTIKSDITEIDLKGKWIDETVIEDAILDDRPDVIYCIGINAYKWAYQLAEDRNKIVFSSVLNWERLKLRGNTFGVSNELSSAMELMTFLYFFPNIKKLGILYSKSHNQEWLTRTTASAEEVNAAIVARPISKPAELIPALQGLLTEVDALWLIPDPIVLSNLKAVEEIFRRCDAVNKPVFAYHESYTKYGAVIAISADTPTIGRQAAVLTQDLLSNKKIKDTVMVAAGSDVVLNLKQVEKYRLKLNKNALDAVSKIIE